VVILGALDLLRTNLENMYTTIGNAVMGS